MLQCNTISNSNERMGLVWVGLVWLGWVELRGCCGELWMSIDQTMENRWTAGWMAGRMGIWKEETEENLAVQSIYLPDQQVEHGDVYNKSNE